MFQSRKVNFSTASHVDFTWPTTFAIMWTTTPDHHHPTSPFHAYSIPNTTTLQMDPNDLESVPPRDTHHCSIMVCTSHLPLDRSAVPSNESAYLCLSSSHVGDRNNDDGVYSLFDPCIEHDDVAIVDANASNPNLTTMQHTLYRQEDDDWCNDLFSICQEQFHLCTAEEGNGRQQKCAALPLSQTVADHHAKHDIDKACQEEKQPPPVYNVHATASPPSTPSCTTSPCHASLITNRVALNRDVPRVPPDDAVFSSSIPVTRDVSPVHTMYPTEEENKMGQSLAIPSDLTVIAQATMITKDTTSMTHYHTHVAAIPYSTIHTAAASTPCIDPTSSIISVPVHHSCCHEQDSLPSAPLSVDYQSSPLPPSMHQISKDCMLLANALVALRNGDNPSAAVSHHVRNNAQDGCNPVSVTNMPDHFEKETLGDCHGATDCMTTSSVPSSPPTISPFHNTVLCAEEEHVIDDSLRDNTMTDVPPSSNHEQDNPVPLYHHCTTPYVGHEIVVHYDGTSLQEMENARKEVIDDAMECARSFASEPPYLQICPIFKDKDLNHRFGTSVLNTAANDVQSSDPPAAAASAENILTFSIPLPNMSSSISSSTSSSLYAQNPSNHKIVVNPFVRWKNDISMTNLTKVHQALDPDTIFVPSCYDAFRFATLFDKTPFDDGNRYTPFTMQQLERVQHLGDVLMKYAHGIIFEHVIGKRLYDLGMIEEDQRLFVVLVGYWIGIVDHDSYALMPIFCTSMGGLKRAPCAINEMYALHYRRLVRGKYRLDNVERRGLCGLIYPNHKGEYVHGDELFDDDYVRGLKRFEWNADRMKPLWPRLPLPPVIGPIRLHLEMPPPSSSLPSQIQNEHHSTTTTAQYGKQEEENHKTIVAVDTIPSTTRRATPTNQYRKRIRSSNGGDDNKAENGSLPAPKRRRKIRHHTG